MKEVWEKFSDEELVSRIMKGSERAANVLFLRYDSLIRQMVMKTTSNKEDALDLMQDVRMHLFQKIKTSYKENGKYAAWQHRVIENFICSHYRKVSYPVYELKLFWLKAEEGISNSTREYQEKMIDDLMDSFSRLPSDIQELLRLKIWENLSYQKVMDRTGVLRTTVVARILASYKKLYKNMYEKGYRELPFT